MNTRLEWLKDRTLQEDSEFSSQEERGIVDERKLQLAIALMWLVEESETDEKKREIAKRQAEVLRLRELMGVTVTEVAKILSVSPETVKNDYKHAKGKILHFIETIWPHYRQIRMKRTT